MLVRRGMARWIVLLIALSTGLEMCECALLAGTFSTPAGGLLRSQGNSAPDDSGDCCARAGPCTCCSPMLIARAVANESTNTAWDTSLIARSPLPNPERDRF